jgi:hypothetical protein
MAPAFYHAGTGGAAIAGRTGGNAGTRWLVGWRRERIGNAVPPNAAKAIAEVMGTTLLLAWSGETFMLSSMPIWVRPVAVALAVENGARHDA